MSDTNAILVADDSLTIRKLVENVLREDGYRVITVDSGSACLAEAAAQKPNLILLDYVLPDMPGTEVCRSLINSSETWEIPVLMMSSNGNAIRQLYQDLNNVADYLTKPFAPNVLKAVVGHLLQKERPAAAAPEAETAASATAGPAATDPAMPKEFMDKVARLLTLMENQSVGASTEGKSENPPANGADTKPAAERSPARKTPRRRKPLAAAPLPDAAARKVRLTLQKHLRSRMPLIPEWESRRGQEPPEEFFLSRILPKDFLQDLGADVLKALGVPDGSPGVLCCPSSLVPLDGVLRHLHADRVTGELRIELEEETILVGYEQGQVVLITSNQPRNYCAGAACDFQTVPHVVIGEAVRAQQELSLPFFLSLKEAGHLPAEASLETLLRRQGYQCLKRAFKAAQSTAVFSPLARLSATARACKMHFPLSQCLLVCYRTVDDWFTLEKLFPDMEATLVPSAGMEGQLEELDLEPEESRLLEALRPGRTVPEISEANGLKPFEACQILFRLIKLGLVRQGPRLSHDTRVDEELPRAIEPDAVLANSSTSHEPTLPAAEGLVGEVSSAAAPADSASAVAEATFAAPGCVEPAVPSVVEPESPMAAVATEEPAGTAASEILTHPEPTVSTYPTQ